MLSEPDSLKSLNLNLEVNWWTVNYPNFWGIIWCAAPWGMTAVVQSNSW